MKDLTSITTFLAIALLIIVPALMHWTRRRRLQRVNRAATVRNLVNPDTY